jgi:DNA gyrase subunit A
MSDTIPQDGNIQSIHIEDEMRGAYLDYAMSVIIGRALPDVRDGLKPVHRRALFAMYDLGNSFNKPYKKSARVVGDVIGKYHPHGDTAVYDTIVRMAQPFSLRYPLVDGQGNFGSIDGDSPAAMRYTEVRMERITSELLSDLDKNTVDFVPNYDESLKEPSVFPAKFPNLLVNGSSGIAVGMATNIPPHNLNEIIDATTALIKDPKLETIDLLQYVKGPDFPTYGMIMGDAAIKKAYLTGRGVVIMRGRAEIEEHKNDRERIVITELPYQVNKARLIEKIAFLVKEKKIEGISDLRDESDRKGMRVVIDVKKGEMAHVILNRLYKLTQLQDSFGISLLAIHQNRPKVFNLKDMIWAFIEHRKEVVLRRTAFELEKAEARAHILEGLKKAVENIDEVVQLIKSASNPGEAKFKLKTRFELSDIQAQAILDMRLQRLTGLERDKIVDEYHEVLKLIEELKLILNSEKLVFEIIEEELRDIKERYGDQRRTEIAVSEDSEFEIEDLIADEEVLVTVTRRGYIKRTDPTQFRSQHRGGKGIRAVATEDDDFVTHIFATTTHTNLLCLTTAGRVYQLKVYKIPEGARTAKGKAIVNLLPLMSDEKIVAILPIKEFNDDEFIVFCTKEGVAKKTRLSEFKNLRNVGMNAIGIKDEDQLLEAKLSDGKKDILLLSKEGKCIRFMEDDLRPMGRTARGVIGMNISGEDRIVSMEVLERDVKDTSILTITENGYGKRTPVEEYRLQSRGGKGILAMKTSARNGSVVSAREVKDLDDVMIVSSKGQMIRIHAGGVSNYGRVTQGVRMMSVSGDEHVVALEYMAESNEEEEQGNLQDDSAIDPSEQ